MEEHKEEWKDVSERCWGHENYECSNTGFVRNKKTKKIVKSYMLSKKKRQRYSMIKLWKDNIDSSYALHLIIGQSWIPDPEILPTLDHINRNLSDNSIWNLRWAKYNQQALNRRAHGKSGVKGVEQLSSGNWRASIKNHKTGKIEHLGTFDTTEEAGQAFEKLAIEIHQNNIVFLFLNNCKFNL